MACELKLTYSLAGLISRQLKAGGVLLDENKASSYCCFSLYSSAHPSVLDYMCLCVCVYAWWWVFVSVFKCSMASAGQLLVKCDVTDLQNKCNCIQ